MRFQFGSLAAEDQDELKDEESDEETEEDKAEGMEEEEAKEDDSSEEANDSQEESNDDSQDAGDKKEGKKKSGAAGRSPHKNDTFPRCYFLIIHQIFFHTCQKPPSKAKQDEAVDKKLEAQPAHKKLEHGDNLPGWALLSDLDKGMDGLLFAAFKKWIDELHELRVPDKCLLPGVAIIFPKKTEDEVSDNRRQIILKDGIPETIDQEAMLLYIAWQIYRIVNEMEIAADFSRYIPETIPRRSKLKGVLWPTEKSVKPIHLYATGFVLIFGGMATEKIRGGKKVLRKDEPKRGEELQHQAAHTDFNNSKYPHLYNCELLHGLAKPFSVNIALEDMRQIYIRSPKQVCTFTENEVLLVGGDTVHGGMAYIHNPKELPVRWHPSLHFTFASRRYNPKANAVSLSSRKGDYLPEAYAADMEDDTVLNKWKELYDELEELSTTIFARESVKDEAWEIADQKMKLFTKKRNKKANIGRRKTK